MNEDSACPPEAQRKDGTRLTTRALAWRSLATGFVVAGVAVVAAPRLAAEAIASHNSDAPVNFAADHMELQDQQKRVLLTGHVDITQDDLRLTADRTTLAYRDGSKLTLQRLDAVGQVVVTRSDERATGDVAVYDFDRKIITMIGHVALRRGAGDTLNGGRLVIDLNTHLSSVDGHAASDAPKAGLSSEGRPGRVSGTFDVPKKDGQTH